MGPTRLAGATFVVTLALVMMAAATATAASLPSILPTASGGEPVTFTGSSGKSTFGDGLEKVTSEKSTSTGSGNATKAGTFNIIFKESKDVLGTACTGLTSGETSGNIEATGTFHVLDYNSGSKKELVADAFSLATVHFSCGSSILVIIHGSVVGAVTTPVNTLGKTLTVQFSAKSGDNEIIKVLNEENSAEENCELTASQNEGEFKLGDLEATETLLGFKKGATAVEILVMPL
jgi:hypothetical protein